MVRYWAWQSKCSDKVSKMNDEKDATVAREWQAMAICLQSTVFSSWTDRLVLLRLELVCRRAQQVWLENNEEIMATSCDKARVLEQLCPWSQSIAPWLQHEL